MTTTQPAWSKLLGQLDRQRSAEEKHIILVIMTTLTSYALNSDMDFARIVALTTTAEERKTIDQFMLEHHI